jgi:lathosterol oxidase
MDLILQVADRFIFTPYVYPATFSEDNMFRQYITFFTVICVGGSLLYLIPGALAYQFLFDKRLRQHKRFIPNQEWLEIKYALWSIPYMAIPTAALFVAEVQGYSRLYDSIDDHPWGIWFLFLTVPCFLFFTDMSIYWIHRWLHHPLLYGFHKPHHRWIICTPFASHAFHPVDGFSQSFPYHMYAFLFPMHKVLYLVLFVLVNFWSTSIHDENYKVPAFLRSFINGSAHHTDHHIFFNYNFGQYFTLWDFIGGSHMAPTGYIKGKSVYDRLEEQLNGTDDANTIEGVDPTELAKRGANAESGAARKASSKGKAKKAD